MKKLFSVLSAALLVLSVQGVFAGGDEEEKAKKAQEKREKIDKMTEEVLDKLFEQSDKAEELYDKAYGYGVFDNTKVSLGISGGGGHGKVVEKETGKGTYMKMGKAGIGLGLGAQTYQVIFLFQDSKTFKNFVDKGWEAEADAHAVAGTAGANVETNFRNGVAVYQITKGGLMLSADISGTKYWQNKKLNKE